MDSHVDQRKTASIISASDATFGRHALSAPVPVLVLFGARACQASRAMALQLGALAESYTGQLRIVKVGVDTATFTASNYDIQATPTLLALQHGEPLAQVVGFLPDGLLRIFCDQVARDELRGAAAWGPIEEVFEDVVVLPLLQRWGLQYQRQVTCALPGRGRQTRGRIDILVSEQIGGPPLTLFESKRRIASAPELHAAAAQAHAYARALGLRSFVVAAPSAMWVYACAAGQPACVRQISGLDLQQQADLLPSLLRQLAR